MMSALKNTPMSRFTTVASTALAALLGTLVPAFAIGADVVNYYQLDAIGDVMAVTNQSAQVLEAHDYLPFGEECTTGVCASNPGVGAGQPRKFTGKERDAESGLDYFGARYYGAKMGRFTTTDPRQTFIANALDPQRWNRYAYGRNNPLRFVDPDGKDVVLNAAQLRGGQQLLPPAALPPGASTWQRVAHAIAVIAWATTGGGVMPGAAIVTAPEAIATEAAISMDEAVARGAAHVGGEGIVEITPKGNYQFRTSSVNEAGETETQLSRFDVNPADPHVVKNGPHLNIETHVDGVPTANAHTPIDPKTIRAGDFPPAGDVAASQTARRQ